MPSRALAVSASLVLTKEGSDSGRRLSVDLARRKLSITGAGEALEAIDFGLLQTAPQWASVTGWLRDTVKGEDLGFVLTVDESNRKITLQIDGRPTQVYEPTS